ncbi:chromosomal replication initiator protein DnaA [Patescibacteria group bacterium]|nr:MAG: chromosomal replication initiator protein DnaA [Patescibacteria group bacterium]
MDSRKVWQAVLGELELSVSRAAFKTWFKQTALLDDANGRLVVAVPNIFTKNRLEKTYGEKIKDILKRVNSPVESIEYKITNPPTNSKKSTKAKTAAPTSSHKDQLLAPATASPTVTSTSSRNLGSSRLNQKYTFENFVIGPSNELAYAASLAVAKHPGTKYNPLFLYGGVGLGKTHLMQAIGNRILAEDSNKRVAYVTSEDFTREFLDGIQNKTIKSFTDRYRSLDVLIVDDIQFLGKKERTQEEFFHTFNALYQANKQVILSSDQPPSTIPNLEARLRSRFESGMVADVQKPDLETREAIIERKAAVLGAELTMDVVEYLAKNCHQNIRELEGTLTSILAQCELKNQAPTIEFVAGLLGSVSPKRARSITPKFIIDQTAAYYDLMSSDILGTRRDREIVVPRQIAMFLMRTELGLSYPKIAKQVGGRDHSTAVHSVTKIEKAIESDHAIRSEVNLLRERLSA